MEYKITNIKFYIVLHFLFLLYCFNKNFDNCERKYIYLITKINSIKYVYI